MSETGRCCRKISFYGCFGFKFAAAVGRSSSIKMAASIFTGPPTNRSDLGKRYAPLVRWWMRGQRCWVHKTANVLNKLPKRQQLKAKRALQEIWMAETKKDALAAFDAFVETWGVKYDKAVECLIKDRDALLASYDFPAEHWKHLRTTDEMDKRFFHPATILLFGRACHSRNRRAQERSRLAYLRPPAGLALTASSMAARWRGTGCGSWRGCNLPAAQ